MGKYTIYPLHCGDLIRGSERLGLHFRPGVPFSYPIIAWYLTDGTHKVMVDTAGPPEMEEKMPMSVKPEQLISNALGRLGVTPGEIEVVITTHLHWDHSYNNDLFPNAKFYVQRKELAYSVTALPIHAETYLHWERFLKTPYLMLDGDADILDGISVITTPGHTPGSQSVVVDTTAGTFVLISDLVNTNDFWEAEPKIAGGVHHDLSDCFASFDKVSRIADYVLTGHDPKIVTHRSYPNDTFPRKQSAPLRPFSFGAAARNR
jgi:glyoxylase-like metal-dependent hydrolase (beta-lactamase superfamily II)